MNFTERRNFYQNTFPISLAVLKAVAYSTMLIDHVAAFYLSPMLESLGIDPSENLVYTLCRHIGRLAFVIFAYMIAEGMHYTRNRGKYILRLALFCLISEFPFDLANGHLMDNSSQSVYITLTLGAICIFFIQSIRQILNHPVVDAVCIPILTACFAYAGFLCKCDYKGYGVVLIVVFYLTRENYLLMFASAAFMLMPGYVLHTYLELGYVHKYTLISFCRIPAVYSKILLTESYGMASVLLFYRYGGKKGPQLPKPFYYLFYPVHLLIIGLLRVFSFGLL